MRAKISILIKILKEFKRDCSEFSLNVAVARFISNTPFVPWNKRRAIYEKSVYNYLKKELSFIIENTLNNHDEDKSKTCQEKRIWVMWWQGEESMPPIVKACYRQLKSIANDCEIILLTEKNLNKYLKLPSHIYEKVNEGCISLTHFSDIIRVNLLKKYGGAWFDATLYVSKIPDRLFNSKLYTINAKGIFPNFIGRGAWQTYYLCTNKTNTIFFECLANMFTEYWLKHNNAIDYLFFDYFIDILDKTIEEISLLISNAEKNTHFYDLNLVINDAYSKENFDKILIDCPIQKLTYKKQFKELSQTGNFTFYNYIMKGNINEDINYFDEDC